MMAMFTMMQAADSSLSEWVRDYSFMPTQQYFSYIMVKKFIFNEMMNIMTRSTLY